MSSLQPIPHTDSVKLLMPRYNNDGGKATFRVASKQQALRQCVSLCWGRRRQLTQSGKWTQRLSSLPALQTPSTSELFRQTLLSVCRYCIQLLLSLLYKSVPSSAVINSNHILWSKQEYLLTSSTTAIQKHSRHLPQSDLFRSTVTNFALNHKNPHGVLLS